MTINKHIFFNFFIIQYLNLNFMVSHTLFSKTQHHLVGVSSRPDFYETQILLLRRRLLCSHASISCRSYGNSKTVLPVIVQARRVAGWPVDLGPWVCCILNICHLSFGEEEWRTVGVPMWSVRGGCVGAQELLPKLQDFSLIDAWTKRRLSEFWVFKNNEHSS